MYASEGLAWVYYEHQAAKPMVLSDEAYCPKCGDKLKSDGTVEPNIKTLLEDELIQRVANVSLAHHQAGWSIIFHKWPEAMIFMDYINNPTKAVIEAIKELDKTKEIKNEQVE